MLLRIAQKITYSPHKNLPTPYNIQIIPNNSIKFPSPQKSDYAKSENDGITRCLESAFHL
jgi:hypothetical protein